MDGSWSTSENHPSVHGVSQKASISFKNRDHWQILFATTRVFCRGTPRLALVTRLLVRAMRKCEFTMRGSRSMEHWRSVQAQSERAASLGEVVRDHGSDMLQARGPGTRAAPLHRSRTAQRCQPARGRVGGSPAAAWLFSAWASRHRAMAQNSRDMLPTISHGTPLLKECRMAQETKKGASRLQRKRSWSRTCGTSQGPK